MSDWTFDTDGPVTLDAKLNAGRLDVQTTDGGPVEITSGTDAAQLEVTRAGQTILVRHPKGWFSGRVRLAVKIPKGSSLELSVGSVDVTVDPGCDEVQVAGASGDIRIASARRIRVASASGDVRFGTVHGDASVSAASADVIADHVEGDLTVSLASGDVRVGRVDGDVSVSTASGDVRIDRCDGSSIDLKTISGDVQLGLPTGIRVDADLNSLTGRISLPERQANASPATRNVRLSARTTSGDVTIRRA